MLLLTVKAPASAPIDASATTLIAPANVADVAPERTVTFAGTCAAAVLLLDRSTVAPFKGAAPFKVTVPVEDREEISVLENPRPIVGRRSCSGYVVLLRGVDFNQLELRPLP